MKVHVRDNSEFQKMILIKGYSFNSLAIEVGISSGYVSQIATGKRNPSGKVARLIADAIKVDFEDIFFIDTAHNSNQIEAK